MGNRPRLAGHLLSRPNQQRYVYFIGPDDGPIKIGTSSEPALRLRELQTGNHERLHIHAVCVGDDALERHYHARFADTRIRGEWFHRSPDVKREMRRLLREFRKAKRIDVDA